MSLRKTLFYCVLGAIFSPGINSSLCAQGAPLLEDPPGIVGVAPTPVGGYTTSLFLALNRARNGSNRTLYGGGLEGEAGVAEGLDVKFGQALEYGPAAPYAKDEDQQLWGGGTLLAARWQLMEEEGAIPSLGILGTVQSAYGETSRPSQSGSLSLLMSKTLIEGDRPLAIYGNASWTELFNPLPGERPSTYGFGVGLAQNLAPDTSLGLSYIRSQQDRGVRDENIVAAAISHRLSSSGPILGFGAGAGIGRDSPSFLVFASMKWLFGAAAE